MSREIEIPDAIVEVFFDAETGLWRPSRYKFLYGGRGSAKSESVARLAIAEARVERPKEFGDRILCARMYQNSIADSVHKTLSDAAWAMGVAHEFDILDKTIRHRRSGVEFLFRGLKRSIGEIKSMKGLRRVWVEEAQGVDKDTWDTLDPTIRANDSELWGTLNPDAEADATYQRFIVNTPADAIVKLVNWRDNPWFPAVLEKLRAACQSGNPDAYDWIWEGKPRKITDAVIFRNRVSFDGFDELDEAEIIRLGGRLFYGMDFGFANDPSVLVRCYLLDEVLWVTHAVFGYHVELDDLPRLMEEVPGARQWPIKADNSRPETISHLAGKGFNISAADKWPGSVEDGITHLKGLKGIRVQAGLRGLSEEFRLYSYKTDPRQLNENGQPMVLPIILDRWNHGIDAIRYALDGYIQGKGRGRITADMKAWASKRR